jgi:hypothetical protein
LPYPDIFPENSPKEDTMFGGKGNKEDPKAAGAMDESQAQLKTLFQKLPSDIPLLLFAGVDKKALLKKASRKITRSIRVLSPKSISSQLDIHKRNITGNKQFITAPCHGTEGALVILKDLVNPYRKKEV